MLLLPNRKKAASIIVAGMRSKKPDYVQGMGEPSSTGGFKVDGEESGGEDPGLESAMTDFAAATEAKDAKAMAAAFRSAMTLCEADESDYEGD